MQALLHISPAGSAICKGQQRMEEGVSQVAQKKMLTRRKFSVKI
jgi:hypothetical protein